MVLVVVRKRRRIVPTQSRKIVLRPLDTVRESIASRPALVVSAQLLEIYRDRIRSDVSLRRRARISARSLRCIYHYSLRRQIRRIEEHVERATGIRQFKRTVRHRFSVSCPLRVGGRETYLLSTDGERHGYSGHLVIVVIVMISEQSHVERIRSLRKLGHSHRPYPVICLVPLSIRVEIYLVSSSRLQRVHVELRPVSRYAVAYHLYLPFALVRSRLPTPTVVSDSHSQRLLLDLHGYIVRRSARSAFPLSAGSVVGQHHRYYVLASSLSGERSVGIHRYASVALRRRRTVVTLCRYLDVAGHVT